MAGTASLMGTPGKPAPEPTSASASGRPAGADPSSSVFEHACGEERLAEMTGYDLIGIAHCGQIHARVPAQQQIEIGLQLPGEVRGQRFAAQEWLKQRDDAGDFHGGSKHKPRVPGPRIT